MNIFSEMPYHDKKFDKGMPQYCVCDTRAYVKISDDITKEINVYGTVVNGVKELDEVDEVEWMPTAGNLIYFNTLTDSWYDLVIYFMGFINYVGYNLHGDNLILMYNAAGRKGRKEYAIINVGSLTYYYVYNLSGEWEVDYYVVDGFHMFACNGLYISDGTNLKLDGASFERQFVAKKINAKELFILCSPPLVIKKRLYDITIITTC